MIPRAAINLGDDRPNTCLREFLLRFFAEGPHLATLRYRICSKAIKIPLIAVVRGGPLQVAPALPEADDLHAIVRAQINDSAFVQTLVNQSPWNDSKMAAEFVTLLCADLEDLEARVSAAAFNSRKLGGFPTTTDIRMNPSADLPAALAKAIAVQCAGDAGRAASGGVTVAPTSTCLAVSLVDCTALRAEEQRAQTAATAAPRFFGYTHRFVLLVDAAGVGLYQAWGTGGGGGSAAAAAGTAAAALGCGGYSLQDWLQQRAPADVMSYEQATDFARTLQDFCGYLSWDGTANERYLELFGVDLRAHGAARGLTPPSRIRSWTRILEVPYVSADRIRANAALFM